MLLIKRNVANVRISAFTLIELLLSLSLASLILLGASKLYSDFQLNLQKTTTADVVTKRIASVAELFTAAFATSGLSGKLQRSEQF